MSIDLRVEKLITFPEAARLLPTSTRPSYATWWRWSRRGIRGVKLETVLIGGKRYTTEAAMQRFAGVLSAGDAGRFSAGSSLPPCEQSLQKAEAQLREKGIL